MKVRTYPVLYRPATRPSAALWAFYFQQRQHVGRWQKLLRLINGHHE